MKLPDSFIQKESGLLGASFIISATQEDHKFKVSLGKLGFVSKSKNRIGLEMWSTCTVHARPWGPSPLLGKQLCNAALKWVLTQTRCFVSTQQYIKLHKFTGGTTEFQGQEPGSTLDREIVLKTVWGCCMNLGMEFWEWERGRHRLLTCPGQICQ